VGRERRPEIRQESTERVLVGVLAPVDPIKIGPLLRIKAHMSLLTDRMDGTYSNIRGKETVHLEPKFVRIKRGIRRKGKIELLRVNPFVRTPTTEGPGFIQPEKMLKGLVNPPLHRGGIFLDLPSVIRGPFKERPEEVLRHGTPVSAQN